jgi:hypothetical protein
VSVPRLLLATVAAVGALAVPASASAPDPSDYVTVTVNPFVVCVTDPCNQPTPVTVCVVPLGYCTPK